MNIKAAVLFGLIILVVGWGIGVRLSRRIVIDRMLPKTPSVVQPSVSAPVRIPILMYHYVEMPIDPKDTIRRGLDILPSTFDSQVSTLLQHGYSPLFMSDLAQYFDGKTSLPAKPIILTFDDGYRDFYTDAYPILLKHQVKATAYIISGVLGKNNYMTAQQVKEIASSGVVEVAAHTVHHVNLKGAPQQELAREIDQSKISLEQLTGRAVIDFAYPYGAFDDRAIDAVISAGFHTAVTTRAGVSHGPGDRFVLARLRPGARTGEELISWLNEVKN